MWMATRKTRSEVLDDARSPKTSESNTQPKIVLTSKESPTADDWKTSLPLDWTHLGNPRKRKASDNTNDNNEDEEYCCSDPGKCRRLRHQDRRRSANGLVLNPRGNNVRDSNNNSILDQNHKQYHGLAIFCLHDTDNPSWVQGYFLPTGTTKPWGLLAIQEDIDDCLACTDGGYRRVTLTVYPSQNGTQKNTSNQNGNEQPQRRRKQRIPQVDWTGGDMMTLYHADFIDMTAEQLVTGKLALPWLHKYFRGLMDQLWRECCQETNNNSNPNYESAAKPESVLEWLPNVAIVTGSMSLSLPDYNDE